MAQRRYPADFWLNVELAMLLHGRGHLEEGVRCYTAAVALHPGRPEIRVALGRTLSDLGDRAGARAVYREALRLMPNDAQGRSSLGRTLVDAFLPGSEPVAMAPDTVVDVLREAISLQPDDASAHAALGQALHVKGDWDGASVAIREALRLNPRLNVHLGLGIVLREKGHDLWERGDREGAHAVYREALELIEGHMRRYPGEWVPLHNLAFFLATCRDERLRDTGRAVALSRREAELWPDVYWSWHMLGMAQYHAGRALDAIPALERAARDKLWGERRAAWQWFYLALAHRQLGDLYRSTLYYAAAVRWVEEHAPADAELRRLRSYAAAQLGITGGAGPAARPQPDSGPPTKDGRPINP
jgi:tetratricopeptide (TPR) repeat protein